MNEKHLHIITHDVPYPADFGGVVDLFYKIKWLHKIGVKIYLHCFINERAEQNELKKYCVSVIYYKRKKISALSLSKPFIVNSRRDKKLLKNLEEDNYSILMEGIHCSYYLQHPHLKARQFFLRLHNVEFKYYEQLAKHETNFLKKWYYSYEAKLLKKYEKLIADKVQIWTVSTEDLLFYKKSFGANKIQFIPVFLPYDAVNISAGKGSYCLYHGNLEVGENNEAALYLVNQVFSKIKIPLIIAGRKPSKELVSAVSNYSHISIKANINTQDIDELIKTAQINVLPTFQATGIKLKLLVALFTGRHCIVNSPMVANTGLEKLCSIQDSPESMTKEISRLFEMQFDMQEKQKREDVLIENFSNESNVKKLIALI